jgi:16S rRNA (cytosine967-C5)-methyltransferase
VLILSGTNPSGLPGFGEGLFTVQDESSQLASIFLSPRPGEHVLDSCAAPGGKTTHLAQLMNDRGSVSAWDINSGKLPLIEQTAARLGISIVKTGTADAATCSQKCTEVFDRVLADAPCSGLGVIRRNPEGKWWKKKKDLKRSADVQKAILAGLTNLVKPGGVVVYSTCSTSEEENELVIDDFLTGHDDFVIEDLRLLFPQHSELFTGRGFFRSWPHRHGMDGFFAARLKKLS